MATTSNFCKIIFQRDFDSGGGKTPKKKLCCENTYLYIVDATPFPCASGLTETVDTFMPSIKEPKTYNQLDFRQYRQLFLCDRYWVLIEFLFPIPKSIFLLLFVPLPAAQSTSTCCLDRENTQFNFLYC